MIQCSLDLWSLKKTFRMRIYDIKGYTWQSEVSMKFSRHPHRVYSHSQHSAASVARHCYLNYEGFWCSSRYNNGERDRSKRSESKGKAADRRDSLGKASSEVSALGSSQGSSCSDGDISLAPSSAPVSERTSGAAGSRTGAKGPKPLPPPRKPHTAETLQARSLVHIRLLPAQLRVGVERCKNKWHQRTWSTWINFQLVHFNVLIVLHDARDCCIWKTDIEERMLHGRRWRAMRADANSHTVRRIGLGAK